MCSRPLPQDQPQSGRQQHESPRLRHCVADDVVGKAGQLARRIKTRLPGCRSPQEAVVAFRSIFDTEDRDVVRTGDKGRQLEYIGFVEIGFAGLGVREEENAVAIEAEDVRKDICVR